MKNEWSSQTGTATNRQHIICLFICSYSFQQDSSDLGPYVYLHLLRPTSVRWLSTVIASLTTRLTGTWTNWTSTTIRWSRTRSYWKRCRTWSSIRRWARGIPPTFFPSLVASIVIILRSTITTRKRSISTNNNRTRFILGANVFGLSSLSRCWCGCR